jgi:hypothetical protein
MRHWTSFSIFFLLQYIGFAQPCQSTFHPKKELAAHTYLCPDAMQADLAQLHKHILETHPNPTYYGSLTDLSEAYDAAKAQVEKPLSVFEFSLVVNTYLFALKDSHTGINPKQFLYEVNGQRKVLPFFVEMVNDKFYISGAYNPDFIIGAELLQIDTISVQQLYDYALALSLSEGDATAAKEEVASEYISVVYNLLAMNLRQAKSAKVQMVTPQGDTLRKDIAFSTSWKYFLAGLFSSQEEEVRYSFDENNNGILVVESFQPLSLSLYKKQIDAFFEEVERRYCSTIFIDLRNNLGGLLRAEEYLFSYINNKQASVKTNYLYKRSDYDRFALLSPMQQMQFVNRAKNVYPNGLISKEYDFYKLPKGATKTILYDYLPENDRDYVFKGSCNLVVNGNSMSASVLFAAWFRHIERGQIFGTPCMGGMGGTFGNPAIITLKNAHLDVMVATLKFTPFHVKDRVLSAIYPDVMIKATREDIIEQRDPFLEYLKGYQK